MCQVALTDARIILSTVKNSGGTAGLFACYWQSVIKISSEGGWSFLFSFLCTFSAVYLAIRLY